MDANDEELNNVFLKDVNDAGVGQSMLLPNLDDKSALFDDNDEIQN